MDDVIIIGGGPAGSSLGCYLSKLGIKNTIIEKANHPRDHVGESLVTNTTRIFAEIGFLPTMEKEGFVKKYGAAWHAPKTHDKLSIEFAEFPLPDVHQPYSYHLDRGKFDMLLLKHAESLGSQVYQGMAVTKVLFDDAGFANGVRVKIGNQSVDLHSKMIVDASGRDTFLGRTLKIKTKDANFNQYAIHGWYEGVDRGEGNEVDFIHIYFLPIEKGWVWQIPIDDEVTSIGVVTEKNDFLAGGTDIDTWFNTHVQTNPNLVEAMQNAKQVKAFKAEGDYSYSMNKFVGDGYIIVGDAARFVDPIFSSGISVALHSAKFASERIAAALEANDFSEVMLKPYEEKLREGVEVWYEFIRLYYKLLPLFTHFIQKPEYRMQLFRLLQGEVFSKTEAPVLDAMREYIEKVESTDNHLFKSQLMESVPIN